MQTPVNATSRRRARRFLALVAGALLLGGCGDGHDWALKNLYGLMPDLRFEMTHAGTGEPVDESAFEGRIVALFFGFTNCDHACPMTMAKLNAAMNRMDTGADAVRVLFVTVDPERDSPETLHEYVTNFGPEFIGLRGNDRQLLELTKRYRTTFSRGEPDAKGDYPVTHSSAVYVFDPEGRVRLMALEEDSVADIARDLEQLARLNGE